MNTFKYFLAVIKEQSVIKAAERMGVSQPTVSYSIHTLQRDLGEQLFEITRAGITPTPRALLLYRRLYPVYVLMMQTIDNFVQNTVR